MSDWQARAACRDTPPELFFPLGAGDTCPEAQRICATCPVRDECLADALRLRDTFGYRGGTSGEARRQMLVGKPKPDIVAEMRRLHGLKWTTEAICLRLAVSPFQVWRAVSRPKEAA